jgi:hypothetical protein
VSASHLQGIQRVRGLAYWLTPLRDHTSL